MTASKDAQAVSAYLKFLHGKKISKDAMAIRANFLDTFVILLQGKSTREEYGQALNAALKIDQTVERHQLLNIAREFFPFWVNDVKMIARISETYGYDLSIAQLRPLPALSVEDLNNQKMATLEADLLSRYESMMREKKLADELIQARLRLAKLVLLRLRDIPIKNNVSYRMAVEATLPMFSVEDIRQRFLVTIREFFHIWIAKMDPMYMPLQFR